MVNAFIQEHDLFPAALPFHTGWLSRDGHDLYFEECGKQTGRPILFLHGGPGAGITPSHRRLFNPDRFRCILFDQRGSGQSRPFAAIESNTTELLIGDIEALRQHLGIEEIVETVISRIGNVNIIALTGDYAKGIDSGIIQIVIIADEINNEYLENIETKIRDRISREVNFIIDKKVPKGGIVLYKKES